MCDEEKKSLGGHATYVTCVRPKTGSASTAVDSAGWLVVGSAGIDTNVEQCWCLMISAGRLCRHVHRQFDEWTRNTNSKTEAQGLEGS